MISAVIEFMTQQDLQETLQRMNITDIIAAPDNPLLVQVPITPTQFNELTKLKKQKKSVKSIFQM